MKSIIEFNDEQRKNFTILANDATGASMTGFVLSVLECVAYEIAQPDIDPTWINEETKADFEVCMAALEFLRMHKAAKGK